MGFNYSFSEETYVLVGTVSKAHSMKGEVKIFAFSGQPENISAYQSVFLVDSKGKMSPRLHIMSSRAQGKMAITLLATINSRDLAEKIEGMGVLLEKSALPDIGQNEYYWYKLIGKEVVDPSGLLLGIVKELFSNGAQDVLVISTDDDDILIPLVEGIVLNTSEQQIVIDPPLGLLDINKTI